MSVAVDHRPISIAGFPLQAWAFAGRTWLSVVLALYVSFWLELESPATAALTVAILAFPSRGQGMEKAGFRLIATVIGVTASIIIVGVFTQTEWLLLAVLAAWMGLCVYASGLFDGFRSYAAVLCATTVCLVVVQQIDTPQNVFIFGMQRGAAIVIGILSVALVNDVLSAPDYHPAIAARLEGLHLKVAALASRSIRGEVMPPATVATLLREITSLRPEITSLATESSAGRARSAAARTAMVDLVFQLAATRTLAALRAAGTPQRENLNIAKVASDAGVPKTEDERAFAWMTTELRRRDSDVLASLASLRQGIAPKREWRAPLYRSHRIAAANGIRAAIYFGLAALVLAAAGWSSADVSLTFVGILIALSALSPDQTAASTVIMVAVPVGCLLAGILEFVVLDGVTAFPLLAIGLLPFVMVPAMLMTIANPALLSFGRAILVFTIAIFAPSNPQTYNPQTFLFSCLFLSLAALLLFICQHLAPPISGMGRLRVLLTEVRRDLAQTTIRPGYLLTREEAMFRDAVRIGQIVVATAHQPTSSSIVDEAIGCFDRAATLRLASAALDMLPSETSAQLREGAIAAVTNADGPALLAVANALTSKAHDGHSPEDASAALAVAGLILGAAPAVMRRNKQ
jgi:uncharacterized membrane protein YccC